MSFVTISRQAGSGGITIGEKLAKYLSEQLPGKPDWTVYDKNLVEEVIKDNNLSKKSSPYLEESAASDVKGAVDVLTGVRSASSVLVGKTNQTLLHLSRKGRVILVGRGASMITKFTAGGVHVRLLGSLKIRKDHIQEYYHLNAKEAKAFMEQEDEGRADYLKKYFDWNIDDPLLYDVIINTDTMSYDDAALLIKDMVVRKITEKGV